LKKFESIYNEFFGDVYKFLYSMCRDQSVAEELTQETFYQAFLSMARFRGKSSISTWLIAIAKNTYFKYLKKKKNEDIDYELICDFIAEDEGETPENIVEGKELISAVKASLKKLPAKYRDVLMLRLYADMPFSKIAELLSISENSARVLFFRAKNTIEEDLANERYL